METVKKEQAQEVPRLNPRVKTMDIGIEYLRKIKIFPLSAACQFKIVGMFGAILESIASMKDDSAGASFMELIGDVIKNNIHELISFVTNPDESVTIEEFDNEQLLQFIETILEVNYGEELVKKYQGAWEKARGAFRLTNSLPS